MSPSLSSAIRPLPLSSAPDSPFLLGVALPSQGVQQSLFPCTEIQPHKAEGRATEERKYKWEFSMNRAQNQAFSHYVWDVEYESYAVRKIAKATETRERFYK